MQEPTEDKDDEASISMENETEDENLNRTFAVRRKAAKRTLPWDLAAGELDLVSPSQAEDIRATKKPRLEEPISASTDETTANTALADRAVALPADSDQADADPVTGAPASSYWSPEEDAKLKSAVVANTCRRKCGKQYIKDWVSIAALFPYRTQVQCSSRWHYCLNRNNIDQVSERTGKWSEDEDSKLKDSVQMHGGNNWGAIAVLVPGRTSKQCCSRWKDVLDIEGAIKSRGKWAEDEDIKLKDAVQTHGVRNWCAIIALVPSRTKKQCQCRWYSVLDPSIDRTSGHSGKWSEDEDIKLKDSVQTHGGKNWGAIAELVPGRTRIQCVKRWKTALDPSIDRTSGRTGHWTEDEDIKLKDAVQTHGGKNWSGISALVPGRTKMQCTHRWYSILDPSIDRAGGRPCKWAEDEDIKLKGAVQTHGGKNWGAIAALVPGRTEVQCRSRWHGTLIPNMEPTTTRVGKWSEDEDIKLKDAVQVHGSKKWNEIAALVPDRTKRQCCNRWHQVLVPRIDRASERSGT
jgi:hypothetical protein